MPPFLLALLLRPLVLASLAALPLVFLKSAAARHALLSILAAGMLTIALALATLPIIPVPVMKPAARVLLPSPNSAPLPARFPTPPPPPFPWATALYALGVALLACRLAYGYSITRRLVSRSRRIPPIDGVPVYESPSVPVPLTVGFLRPKILLPLGWDSWTPEKLDAVLVHERNHVRRGDWPVALLSAINCCIFWFHPLAWWLDSRLKMLAEQACDDASLPHVASPEFYAEVLVEIAAAVRAGQARSGWGAVAMAKGAEVRMRIERILDDNRPVAPAMTPARWLSVALCAIPAIYLSAVLRPVPAQAQEPLPASRELRQAPPQDSQSSTESRQNREALTQMLRERRRLESQLENLMVRASLNPASVSDLQRLRQQLTEAREIYTPQHPTIRRLQEDLASAENLAAGTSLQLEASIDNVKAALRDLDLRLEQQVEEAAAGHETRVPLSIQFGPDGIPQTIRVLHSQGAARDEQAIALAKSLRFVPPAAGGSITVEMPLK
jgi:TonB family protein